MSTTGPTRFFVVHLVFDGEPVRIVTSDEDIAHEVAALLEEMHQGPTSVEEVLSQNVPVLSELEQARARGVMSFFNARKAHSHR